jgi:mono/diheme cytochrome c family protein
MKKRIARYGGKGMTNCVSSWYERTIPAFAVAAIVFCGCAGRSALDDGRAIFQTGKDVDGVQITAAAPPLRPYCAACHGATGAGGVHFPGGAVSADLRHRALVTEQRQPYTLALLERAISRGIDNDGKPLDPVMPRWRLSARDLHDVASYVLTQLK